MYLHLTILKLSKYIYFWVYFLVLLGVVVVPLASIITRLLKETDKINDFRSALHNNIVPDTFRYTFFFFFPFSVEFTKKKSLLLLANACLDSYRKSCTTVDDLNITAPSRVFLSIF